jgi:hypothetical protein
MSNHALTSSNEAIKTQLNEPLEEQVTDLINKMNIAQR